MYIDKVRVTQVRSFRRASIDFVHADAQRSSGLPKAPNINLVIGGNGSGKTTLLKAIAIAAIGPAIQDFGIPAYRLIRREVGTPASPAEISASFTPNPQDRHSDFPQHIDTIEADTRVVLHEDFERFEWVHPQTKPWHPVYSETSEAFFLVAYSASRRLERTARVDEAARRSRSFVRAQRVMGLFEDGYSLIPLSHWLPRYEASGTVRFAEVKRIINQILGPGRYRLTGEKENGEYVLTHRRVRVPVPALSDGYQAILSWISDLLYHLCATCPADRRLVDSRGIVMVDEVDLHIHPEWQRELLPRLAQHLPHVQFIVTSHSPLLVGSMDWRNIIVAKQRKDDGTTYLRRIPDIQVSMLDADQILLTDLFGLQSTRSDSETRRMRQLLAKARDGDDEAATQLLANLAGIDP